MQTGYYYFSDGALSAVEARTLLKFLGKLDWQKRTCAFNETHTSKQRCFSSLSSCAVKRL